MEQMAIISVDGHVKAPRADYREYIFDGRESASQPVSENLLYRFEGQARGQAR